MKMIDGHCWCRILGLCLLVVGGSVCGQDEETHAKRRLRVLAVGDVPPFRQEIRNGVRYELDAPKGSVPPRTVGVFAEGLEKGQLDLQLKRISTEVVVPGAGLGVALRAEGTPWHLLKVPEGGDVLAVLWRDFTEGSWDKARSLTLRDGPEFGGGQVRFVNICPMKVGVLLGDQRILLERGAVVTRKVGVTDGLPIQISFALPQGGSKRAYSSAFVQNRGERATVVVYRADGENPRSPVKVIILRETVPAPLKPEKKVPNA